MPIICCTVRSGDLFRDMAKETWPPTIGATWVNGMPIEFPKAQSWDMAFELSTNEGEYIENPIPGDIWGPAGVPDGVVNLYDFAKMAENWLATAP